jgi:hypothetical protein
VHVGLDWRRAGATQLAPIQIETHDLISVDQEQRFARGHQGRAVVETDAEVAETLDEPATAQDPAPDADLQSGLTLVHASAP